MLKPLTLSLSLVVALSAAGVSLAGGHKSAGCDTCGIASPQGSVVSPQSVVASPQGCDTGCDDGCGLKKAWNWKLPKLNLNFCKPKTYSYEWVLKKKRVWGHHDTCSDCGAPAAEVWPTSQASPQGPWAAPQAAPKAHPAGQHAFNAPGEMRPALAADEVPPAPAIATQSRLLQLTPAGN